MARPRIRWRAAHCVWPERRERAVELMAREGLQPAGRWAVVHPDGWVPEARAAWCLTPRSALGLAPSLRAPA
jgi:hypothetical protein